MKMEKRGKGRPPSDEPKRILRAVKVPADLDERLVNTAFHCRLSFSEIILNGTEAEISRLEKKYNDGKPFPPPEEPKR